MKVFAILLILLGPVIAVGSGLYAAIESDRLMGIWLRDEAASMSVARISRSIQMYKKGLAPTWTIVDPWPGVLVGLGCSAFGILLVAIVGSRPRRETDPPDLSEEIPEFKWRKP
jgi:hypothetical protein